MQSSLVCSVVVAVLAAALAPHPASAPSVHRSQRTDCRPPDNMADLFRSLNSHVNTTMLLLAMEHANLTREQNRECPPNLETTPGAHLMARSTCPWFMEVEHLQPAEFFPSVVAHAVCRCHKCIQQKLLGCEHVISHVRVLQYTGCHRGVKTFTSVRRPVSVACLCAVPPMAPTAAPGHTTPTAAPGHTPPMAVPPLATRHTSRRV